MCVCVSQRERERDLEMKSYRNHAPAPPAPCSVPSRPLCFNSFPLSKAYRRFNTPSPSSTSLEDIRLLPHESSFLVH